MARRRLACEGDRELPRIAPAVVGRMTADTGHGAVGGPALVPEELFPRAIFSGVMGFSSGMYVASESRPSGSLGLDGVAPTAPSSVMQTRRSAERDVSTPAPPGSFALPHRNRERARRAHPLLALHPNRPPVQLEELPRQSHPKLVALPLLRRRPRLSKFLSNTWLQLSRFDSNE